MRRTERKKIAILTLLLTAFAVFTLPTPLVWAHGGEDHGDQKVAAAPAGTNMIARVVRVGDFEVTIKHPNVEPNQEALARIFVTRFATNEPVSDAKILVQVDDASTGIPVEVAANPTSVPGTYEVKLPPMMQGECKLSARIQVGGESLVANYGAMQVMVAPAAATSGVALWARTALIVFAFLVALGVIGFLSLLAIRHLRRGRMNAESPTAA